MKRETESLMVDVVGDSLSPEMRRLLLAGVVRTARRARRCRIVSRAGGAAAGLLALGAGLWWLAGGARGPAATGAGASYTLVRSEGAPLALNVKTVPFTGTFRSGRSGFLAVRTDAMQPSYRPLTDLELLAFFGGRGAMLVQDAGRATLFLEGRPIERGAAVSLGRGGGG